MKTALNWKTMRDGHSKRHAYMASREWALKKEAVKKRSGGTCEHCRKAKGTQTHHETYERLYNERLEDLLHVCRPCHEFLSGKTDQDPRKSPAPAPATIRIKKEDPFKEQIEAEIENWFRSLRGEPEIPFTAGKKVDPPAIDEGALDAISMCGGSFPVEGFGLLPIVLPLLPYDKGDDYMLFDRAVCKAGLKVYLRPILDSDACIGIPVEGNLTNEQLESLGDEFRQSRDNGGMMLIKELTEGVRTRAVAYLVDTRTATKEDAA